LDDEIGVSPERGEGAMEFGEERGLRGVVERQNVRGDQFVVHVDGYDVEGLEVGLGKSPRVTIPALEKGMATAPAIVGKAVGAEEQVSLAGRSPVRRAEEAVAAAVGLLPEAAALVSVKEAEEAVGEGLRCAGGCAAGKLAAKNGVEETAQQHRKLVFGCRAHGTPTMGCWHDGAS